MDHEIMFLKDFNVLKWDEYINLKEKRIQIENKISSKQINKHELAAHIIVELQLFQDCKNIIQIEITKEIINVDILDTQILITLFKRVIDLFDHMYLLFSIEGDLLLEYLNVCLDNVKYFGVDQLKTLKKAVISTGDVLQLWIVLLKIYVALESNFDKIYNIFEKGINVLGNKSLPLWKLMINDASIKHPNKVIPLCEKGMSVSYVNIITEIKNKYLIWCFQAKGLVEARKLFYGFKDIDPTCCSLYRMMIFCEIQKDNFDVELVLKLYEEATIKYGKYNLEIWEQYIIFVFKFNKGVNVNHVFQKALLRLDSRYAIIMNDCFRNISDYFVTTNNVTNNEIIEIDDD